MINYFIIVSIAIVYALIRAKHDSYLRQGNWKRWARIEALFFTLVIPALLIQDATYFVLAGIFGFSWWLIFDFATGWYFGKNIFYLGQYDETRKIFWNGKNLALVKLIWLVILTGAYFEMIK